MRERYNVEAFCSATAEGNNFSFTSFSFTISALQWLRGTIEVHDEMDEMKQEQESMKLVPKVEV